MVTAASMRSLLLALSCVACADMLDIPSDAHLVKTGPWRCLDSTEKTLATASSDAEVRVRACDFITDCTTDVTGLTAKLCDKRDVGCNQPRLSDLVETNGEFKFRVPTAGGGFDGYLRVDSSLAFCTDRDAFGDVAGQVLCGAVSPQCNVAQPDAHCYITMFAPAMLFFNPPIVRDVSQALPLQMFPSSGLPAVIAAAGIQIDPSGGSLFLQAFDCDGAPAAGVSFVVVEHRDDVQSLYVDNGVVSSKATHTDTSGVGGFVGVPPGFITVVGYNADGLAISEIGLQAAASILTYGSLYPNQ
ncbi:MAG: hypothetical protein QM756_33630 [Polyangiaceae bacterium]